MLITYQKFKNVNHQTLNKDIMDSSLYMEPATSAESLADQYNHVLHQTKLVAVRPHSVPCITDEIKAAQTQRRRLQRTWRSSQLTVHRQMFIHQRDTTATMCKQAKEIYYKDRIEGCRPRSDEAVPADGRAPSSKSPDNTAHSQLLS